MQTVPLSQLLQTKFIGADDLRSKLTDILAKLQNESRVVITQRGKPKAILLDIATYLELTDIQEDVIQPGYIASLYEELAKVKRGKGITHKELLRKLEL